MSNGGSIYLVEPGCGSFAGLLSYSYDDGGGTMTRRRGLYRVVTCVVTMNPYVPPYPRRTKRATNTIRGECRVHSHLSHSTFALHISSDITRDNRGAADMRYAIIGVFVFGYLPPPLSCLLLFLPSSVSGLGRFTVAFMPAFRLMFRLS